MDRETGEHIQMDDWLGYAKYQKGVGQSHNTFNQFYISVFMILNRDSSTFTQSLLRDKLPQEHKSKS